MTAQDIIYELWFLGMLLGMVAGVGASWIEPLNSKLEVLSVFFLLMSFVILIMIDLFYKLKNKGNKLILVDKNGKEIKN